MKIWTYSELDEKVRMDLDLEDEDMIQDAEMLGYCNEAIDEAEAEILKLNEDYFLTSDLLSLVSGTDAYDFPEDIYGQKIRALLYRNGSRRFPITRYRRSQKFEKILEDTINSATSQDYKWYPKNSTDDGYQMVLVPVPAESGAYVTRWYIRNAARMTGANSQLDIPEFANFIIMYMKAMCLKKDNGNVLPPDAAAMLQQQRQMMIDTLTEQVDDDDTNVEGDFTHYQDHS